jgi:hypothetical protein
MSTYSINLETASWGATQAIYRLDQSFVGTSDYMGVAYFWPHEFKHWLRACTVAERKKVHQLWLKNNLSFEAGIDPTIDCQPHWEIIKRVCKTVAREEIKQ